MKVDLYLKRSLFIFLCFVIHSLSLFSQQVAKVIPYPASPDGVIGFLQFTPKDYGTQQHPLIIFLHGIGERGNGTSQINSVTANAIPKFCAAGATMSFTVGGQKSSFVVLSPQLSVQYGYWPTFYITEMIKYAKANLQIDPNRIYITGLSLGGGGIWRMITDASTYIPATGKFDYGFDSTIAAAAPVCGTQEETDANVCSTIAANHLPVWAFHSMDDGTVGVGATQHAEILMSWCTGINPPGKFTYYQNGGHGGAWINAYDTGHITTTVSGGGSFTANPNLYEWFLMNARTKSGNTPPVANAGSPQTITLPTSSVTLNGSGNGTNGANISSYAWTKTSGPASGTITSPGSASTTVTGLTQGTYVFTLTVTDNNGLTATSTVAITVNPVPNQSPVANAGSNINITLPTNSTTLNGSASSDPDGTITTYAWTKTSGPATYNIVTPGGVSTVLNNLVQGTYVFKLQVTDNGGATASSTVTVTVNAAPNQAPVANAGSNINITLPTNSATLNGSASSDPDGTITTYAWTKTSGPATYNIVTPGGMSTVLNNLVQGVYVFTLQVTDNGGATATSTVTVTVNAAPNQAPVANAGSNINLTLPTNSTTLNGSASSDPDGTITTYAWTKTSGPSTYNIVTPGGMSTVLNNLVQGVYVFTLQVTDNGGATASSTVTVIVNPAANQAPVANAGSDISITLPTNSTTLNGSASSDADGTITTYAWTKTSGPSTYNIVSPGGMSTVLNNLVQGVYVFTLQVTDNAGASATSTVTVTVNAAVAPPPPPPPVNVPPVANAGSDINITLPTNSTTLNGSASNDIDGTITTYAWTKTSGPSTYTIANAGSMSTALSNLVQGVYVFTLQVTDNNGASATSNITVTVNAAVAPPPPVNVPPVANAGSDINITLPTNSTTLNGSASNDVDGTITTYAWTKTSGPSTYTIANAGSMSTALSNLVQGVYVFTLQVTDNAGATATSAVTVTVNRAPNKAPVANAGNDISITLPDDAVTLDGSASTDPDGSIVSYSWNKINGPGALTIVNSNTTAPSVAGLTQGQYVFELTVTDDEGATSTDQVVVTVNAEPNKAPLANAGKDTSILLPASSIVLSGNNSSDADGYLTSFIWKQISGPSTSLIAAATSAVTEIDGLVEGDYEFELQVTDNGGAIATSKIKISVVNSFRNTQYFKLYPNPAINTISFQFIDDKTGKLQISAYDVSGKLVVNQEFSKDQSLITKEINISNLKSGVYYLEIKQADGRRLIRPFVKQ